MNKEQTAVPVSVDLSTKDQLSSSPQVLVNSKIDAIEEHEFAGLIPSMSQEEYDSLVKDIKENGQRVPIVLYEDKILDGRNRYKICKELKIEPKFDTYKGTEPVRYVVSMNLMRRNLNSSQSAAAAVVFLPLLEKEAEVREKAGKGSDGSGGRGHKKNPSQRIDKGSEGRSTEKAAKIVGANRQYVSDAKKIKKDDPAAFEEIKQGTKTIAEVKRKQKEYKDDGLKLIDRGIRILYRYIDDNNIPTEERSHVLSAIDEYSKQLEEIKERINAQE